MTALLRNPRERIRFIRFAVVGVIGAVIDFGVSNLLIQLLGTPLVLAGTVSFIAAILSNFTWNRFWTSPDSRSKGVSSQLAQFSLISILGLAIRIPILAFLEPLLEELAIRFRFEIAGFLSAKTIADNLTLAIAVLIVMFWNFFANRHWTYSDVD